MAYEGGMGYQLHMPSYFWRTFTEYPFVFLKQAPAVRYFPVRNPLGHTSSSPLPIEPREFGINYPQQRLYVIAASRLHKPTDRKS